MKKWGRLLLAAVAASALAVTPLSAAPLVDELESERSAAQSEASALQEELTGLLDKMGRLEESLIAKGEEIIETGADLEKAKEQEKTQYDAMKLRIKYMYENGSVTAAEALVTAKNFSDLINKAQYVSEVHSYDRQKLEEYIETKEEIAGLKAALEEEQRNMESLQAEFEQEEAHLSAMLQEKRAQIADFDVQIQAAAEAAAAAAQERAAASQPQSPDGASESGMAADGGLDGDSGTGGGSVGSEGTGGYTENSGIDDAGSSAEESGGAQAGDSSIAQIIVDAAYSQLDVPYVYGGTTPFSGLDCSGLVQYCHAAAGISLPRTSQAQGGCGVSVSSPLPGDIVCYGGHVGIYIGGGQMIHAPKPGDVVRVAAVYGSPWYRRCW